MLRITSKVESDRPATARLCLPIDARTRSRLRVTLEDGREAGLFLPRGLILRGGDRLGAESGEVIEVVAAAEAVSTVKTEDPQLLIRCAYHLGNRHVPLEVGIDYLRYQHDHVLDEMVRGLGAEVVSEQAPFEPEAGAYASDGQGHHHHHHDHDQTASHSH